MLVDSDENDGDSARVKAKKPSLLAQCNGQ